MNWCHPIQIVGLGSPHGWDRIGWDVIESLKSLPLVGVSLHPLHGGHDLFNVIESEGTLVVIDAVQAGGRRGDVFHVAWPHERLMDERTISSHGWSMEAVLQLARTLGMLPPTVELFGIEIGEIDANVGHSSMVEHPMESLVLRKAMEQIVAMIRERCGVGLHPDQTVIKSS